MMITTEDAGIPTKVGRGGQKPVAFDTEPEEPSNCSDVHSQLKAYGGNAQ
jgi:hypothetical protein